MFHRSVFPTTVSVRMGHFHAKTIDDHILQKVIGIEGSCIELMGYVKPGSV